MAFYDTIPTTVSEDALISGPKAAPLNRKAITLVAAVCFASTELVVQKPQDAH